jgi:SAM-dependent methyltransferase
VTGAHQVNGRDEALRMLARYVSGNGVELGPGHTPFPLPYAAATARYVDRWKPDENRELFPELGAEAAFPIPDIVADLNVDRLSMLDDESQDFVIASHVLEHLVDPLAHLEEIHRVLRPGGTAVILLPDRRLTFDRDRPPTALAHLVGEHADGTRTLDDAHIEEFLRCGGAWDDGWNDAERLAQFDLHRQRSIHVHCWTQEEFLPVVRYAITDLGLSWELVDAVFHEDVPGTIEFGLVLRRSLHAGDRQAFGQRLDEIWDELVENHRLVRDATRDASEVASVRTQLAASDRYVREVMLDAENLRGQLARIHGHAGFRLALRINRYLRLGSRLVRRTK